MFTHFWLLRSAKKTFAESAEPAARPRACTERCDSDATQPEQLTTVAKWQTNRTTQNYTELHRTTQNCCTTLEKEAVKNKKTGANQLYHISNVGLIWTYIFNLASHLASHLATLRLFLSSTLAVHGAIWAIPESRKNWLRKHWT